MSLPRSKNAILAGGKDAVFLEIARTLGLLGTCSRAHVGAIITIEGRCVAWGYNGAPPRLPHCSENYHGWDGWWELHDTGKRTHAEMEAILAERGCRNATHAELNAVAFAARQGISTAKGTLYVERSPCDTCARALIAAGIERVVYDQPYHDASGLELLRQAGIECLELT